GSGVSLARLAYRTADAGLEGLEWGIGIPGTVGGAVVCNAGAYGGSMVDVIRQVEVLDSGCDVHTVEASSLGLGYRQSIFKANALMRRCSIILSVDLTLRAATSRVLRTRQAEYLALRKMSQPREPSAGSVFKNPPGHAAGWLIEQVGLKGYRVGNAQISPLHANFIVNLGQARAADILSLITLAQEKVWQRFSIRLEKEIEIVNRGPGAPA
ncbi:MAG: UDP-N-acetylmuramate dehydrogenase, partial [Chloroflexota bacterium]